MTPIDQMKAAAERNPQFTAGLLAMSRNERERRINLLMDHLKDEGLAQEAEEVRLIASHIDIVVLAPLTR